MKAFLMIGQSNMSGRGIIGELPSLQNSHVSVLRGERWETARDPVVFDKPQLAGEGMGISFGSAVYAFTGEEVGLIPCSLGGSALSEWMPGERLFTEAVACTVTALKLGAELSGILWHQGENDATRLEDAQSYSERLSSVMDSLVSAIRSEAHAAECAALIAQPLPIIAGELGDYLDGREKVLYHRIVNAQMHEFANTKPEYECVTAHDLADKGDNLHFSTSSQRRLGCRYADAWMSVVERTRTQSSLK